MNATSEINSQRSNSRSLERQATRQGTYYRRCTRKGNPASIRRPTSDVSDSSERPGRTSNPPWAIPWCRCTRGTAPGPKGASYASLPSKPLTRMSYSPPRTPLPCWAVSYLPSTIFAKPWADHRPSDQMDHALRDRLAVMRNGARYTVEASPLRAAGGHGEHRKSKPQPQPAWNEPRIIHRNPSVSRAMNGLALIATGQRAIRHHAEILSQKANRPVAQADIHSAGMLAAEGHVVVRHDQVRR